MKQTQQINSMQCCPYIEDGYSACSSRFTLGRLDQACSVCFGTYESCSMYQSLANNVGTAHLDMTINGRAVELRPTGS
ncbi:MAG: hypothetical protein HOC27_09065 [Phycisphaerae bacterium]|nr:hypothetical protein [Phycisphaerae bacterium]